MPEQKKDPASTQMFRAFVERGDEAPSRRRLLALVVVVALVLSAAAGIVLALA